MVNAAQNRYALPYPGSNVFGCTFFKMMRLGLGNGVHGEYTYTSELIEMQKEQGAGGESENSKVLFGFFHTDNHHIDHDNNAMFDRLQIEGSLFGRSILHFKESRNFNPWSVLERMELPKIAQPYKLDLILSYGQGEDFIMMGTKVTVEVASYDQNDNRQTVEGRFVQIFEKPLDLQGNGRPSYQSKKIDTFELAPEHN